MNYHKISYDDQLNGEGLRAVLFVSGCGHHCKGCQNPQTWSPTSGKIFDYDALLELLNYLNNDYASGVTFSGGDPLNPVNLPQISILTSLLKSLYPSKTIWIYTGYTFDELMVIISNYTGGELYPDATYLRTILKNTDVLVDGKFEQSKFDNNYKWAGSTNQRIIDVQETLKTVSNENGYTRYKVVHYETE
jgi:anaerobic ribonucleoside-triphosphate reductase activating protein